MKNFLEQNLNTVVSVSVSGLNNSTLTEIISTDNTAVSVTYSYIPCVKEVTDFTDLAALSAMSVGTVDLLHEVVKDSEVIENINFVV